MCALGRSMSLTRSSLSARSLIEQVFSLVGLVGTSSLFLHILCRSPLALLAMATLLLSR